MQGKLPGEEICRPKMSEMFFLDLFILYVCTCAVCVHDALKSQKRDVGSTRTRIINCYEPSCGFWELNPGPLQEQACIFLGVCIFVSV